MVTWLREPALAVWKKCFARILPIEDGVSSGQGELDQLASFLGFDLEGFTDVRMNGYHEFTGSAAT